MSIKKTKYIRDASGKLWLADIVYDDQAFSETLDIFCKHEVTSYTEINHCNHFIRTSGDLCDKFCFIQDIYVKKGSRRHGIGSWMLSEALRFWHEKGITRVSGDFRPEESTLDWDNTSAYNFWIKNNAVFTDERRFMLSDFAIGTAISEISQSEFNLQFELDRANKKLKDCENRFLDQVQTDRMMRNRGLAPKIWDVLRELIFKLLLMLIKPILWIAQLVEYLLGHIVRIYRSLFQKNTK